MQINSAQIAAVGRHVLSFAMGAVAMASIAHVISADQANSLSGAFNQIATGLSSVFAGVATLVSVGTAAYAAYTASTKNQISAAASHPEVSSIVVTNQSLATSIPNDKVTAK